VCVYTYYDYYFFAACFSSFYPALATIHSGRTGLLFFTKLKKALFAAVRVEEVALIMMVLNFVIPCAHTRHSERAGRITFQPGYISQPQTKAKLLIGRPLCKNATVCLLIPAKITFLQRKRIPQVNTHAPHALKQKC
jgi:hypothetical protein